MFTYLPTLPLTPPPSPPLPLPAPQRRPSLLRSPFQPRRSRSVSLSSLKTSNISRPFPIPGREYSFAGHRLLDLQPGSELSEQRGASTPSPPPSLLPSFNAPTSYWKDTPPTTPRLQSTKPLHAAPPRPPRNPARRFSLPALPSFVHAPNSLHSPHISRPILTHSSSFTPASSCSTSSSSLGLFDNHTLAAFPLPPYRTAPLPPSCGVQLPYSEEQRLLASTSLGAALELLEGKRPRLRRARGGDWAGKIPEEDEELHYFHQRPTEEEGREDSPTVSPDLRPWAPPFEFDAPEWGLDDDDFPSTPELEMECCEEDEEDEEREFHTPRLGMETCCEVGEKGEEEMEELWFGKEGGGAEGRGSWGERSLLELYLY